MGASGSRSGWRAGWRSVNALRYGRPVAPPDLTVVVLAGPLRRRAERVLEALARQSALDRLEVIVADGAPRERAPRIPEDLGVRLVTPPPGVAFGELRLAGLEAGSAPYVAFLDDHCYPDPAWAAGVIAAFEGPWAAVGYAFRVANPESRTARAIALAEVGEWQVPVRSGPRPRLAGNNVAYRRADLDALGQPLGQLLDVDFNLQRALVDAGRTLYLAEDAQVDHEHFTKVSEAIRGNALYCAVLAQRRARGWGAARRLAYATVVPAVAPLRRLQALAGAVPSRPGLGRALLIRWPFLALFYACCALGEAAGYLRPRGDYAARFASAELGGVRDPAAVTAPRGAPSPP